MPAQSLPEALGLCMQAGMVLEGLTFGSPPVSVPVVVRKVPVLPSGKDPAQVVIIVDTESRSQPLDALTRLETFAAFVLFVAAGGHKLAFNSVIGAWRDAAKCRIDDLDRQTFASLITGAAINKATYVGGRAPFDTAALGKDLDFSIMPFEIEVTVTRATP